MPTVARSTGEEDSMAAKAGETARETGDFRCERCHQQVHVTKGHKIPKCPHCGNDIFDTRYHEPGRKS
jgi:Zn finger protein HypA/HybF involved in hydrogenase expression